MTVLKKQCELLGLLDRLEDCAATAGILLEKNEEEVTKFVARILSPKLSQLDSDTLSLVIGISDRFCATSLLFLHHLEYFLKSFFI